MRITPPTQFPGPYPDTHCPSGQRRIQGTVLTSPATCVKSGTTKGCETANTAETAETAETAAEVQHPGLWLGGTGHRPRRRGIEKGCFQTGPKRFTYYVPGHLAVSKVTSAMQGWGQCRTGAGIRPVFHQPGATHGNPERYLGAAISSRSSFALAARSRGQTDTGRAFRSVRWSSNRWLETALFTAMAVNPHSP